MFIDDLRCHVRGRAAEHLDFLIIRNARGEAEVDEFRRVLTVKEDILQLDIAMAYFLGMAELN